MSAPYVVGEKVRHLFLADNGGTGLTNAVVTRVDRRLPDRDGYTITTDQGGSFVVSESGRHDYLSAGHMDSCYDCGDPVSIQDGTGTWRGTRDEVVCRGTIPGQAACATFQPRGFSSLATVTT
ncbi:MAG: hypothetical protein JWP27_3064 [Flaviaesturariibacter sp.]|nr:hypothetical protein [Flaviaesturariibacter sp.]